MIFWNYWEREEIETLESGCYRYKKAPPCP